MPRGARAACRVVGLELQPDLVRLAGDNVALNGMAARVTILAGDLLRPPPRLSPACSTMSWRTRRSSSAGGRACRPTPAKAAATIEGEAELADWVRFALEMVRPKGSITFVHRADRIDALLGLLGGPGRRDRRVSAVAGGGTRCQPRPGARAQAGRGAGAAAAGLVLHEADGRFTAAAEAVLRGGEALPL